MKSKEELIKQVVILVIALFVVIVMAICLNMGKGKKDDKEITVRNSQNTTIEENKNEMIEGIISECYANVFMVDTGFSKKSFTYTDVLIGNVLIKLK